MPSSNQDNNIDKQVLAILKKLVKEMKAIGLDGQLVIVDPNLPQGQIYKEYLSLKGKIFKKRFSLNDQQRKNLAKKLNSFKASLISKKKALILLACDNNPLSLTIITNFKKRAEKELRPWAEIAEKEFSLTDSVKQKKRKTNKTNSSVKVSSKSSLSPAKLFKKTPFLFCDRRCDKCPFSSKCPLYQEFLFLRIGRIMQGQDYESIGQVLKDIKLSFQRTEEKINRHFLKLGFNIEELMSKKSEHPSPEHFELWKKGHQLSKEISSLIELITSQEEISTKETIKNLGEIGWYINLFEAKLYRALSNKYLAEKKKETFDQKFLLKDANFSAKLAFYSLKSLEHSLREINRSFPGYDKWINSLVLKIRSISEDLEADLPLLHQEKVIFQGKIK